MTEYATWDDALRPFRFSPKESAIQLMTRLTREWCPILGATMPKLRRGRTTVRREFWTHAQIGEHIDRMIALQPKMLVSNPPRRDAGPIVLMEFAPGVVGQIDGRHRANMWRHRPGRYEVLVIEGWRCGS